MKRTDLVALLQRAAPALSSRDDIPVFAAFCFDGKTVTAYDEIVAITVPAELPFKGAVHGRTLLDWLKTGGGKADVKIESKEEESTWKMGRSKLTLAFVGEDGFPFQRPEGDSIEIPLKAEFLLAMKECLSTMGQDASHPWRLGICVQFQKGKIIFASSDNTQATRVELPFKVPPAFRKKVVQLAPKFCQLAAGMGDEQPKTLRVADDWAELTCRTGLRLFAKTIEEHKADIFEKLFDGSRAAAAEVGLVEVPNGAERLVEQAAVVLARETNKRSSLKVAGGRLRIKTNAQVGLGDGSVATDHAEAEVLINPELLGGLFRAVRKFAITEGCVYGTTDDGLERIAQVYAE